MGGLRLHRKGIAYLEVLCIITAGKPHLTLGNYSVHSKLMGMGLTYRVRLPGKNRYAVIA
jgi:hypothetical protein